MRSRLATLEGGGFGTRRCWTGDRSRRMPSPKEATRVPRFAPLAAMLAGKGTVVRTDPATDCGATAGRCSPVSTRGGDFDAVLGLGATVVILGPPPSHRRGTLTSQESTPIGTPSTVGTKAVATHGNPCSGDGQPP